MTRSLPRLVIAGLSGDAGKSLLALGLARTVRHRGERVAAFKKGPDFIDASWLGRAAGVAGRNLDTFMMPTTAIENALWCAAEHSDIAIVEGNRGLYDGFDANGSHSTAQLAKQLHAPVVLVVDTTKTTATVAAMVLGCKLMDPALNLAGVVLNRVATVRQERVIRDAIAQHAGVEVLGAIPRLKFELPSRHLGLLTVDEHPDSEKALEAAAAVVAERVDVDALLRIAAQAPDLSGSLLPSRAAKTNKVRIGVLRDEAFSFYYPENLEALEQEGAELVMISPLHDDALGNIDALYAGGGFPEVHVASLAANTSMTTAIRERIEQGMPVWAECGGLMYLAQELICDGNAYPMVGALPIVVEQMSRPQGHGYVQACIDAENPFLPKGSTLTGHEFHYSRLREGSDVETAIQLERGTGIGSGRDGVRYRNVMASYTHIHASGTPEWAAGFVLAAQRGVV